MSKKDLDLENVDTEDLIDELRDRGHEVDPETDLSDFTFEELEDEFERRGSSVPYPIELTDLEQFRSQVIR